MTQPVEAQMKHHDEQGDRGGQSVTFEHVNSLQEVKVHAANSATLRQLWEEAYSKLGEPHRPEDRLQTDDARDLMPFLDLTLRQLRDEHGIKSHKFQIV